MILLGYTVRSRKTTRHHTLWCYSALGPHRVMSGRADGSDFGPVRERNRTSIGPSVMPASCYKRTLLWPQCVSPWPFAIEPANGVNYAAEMYQLRPLALALPAARDVCRDEWIEIHVGIDADVMCLLLRDGGTLASTVGAAAARDSQTPSAMAPRTMCFERDIFTGHCCRVADQRCRK